MKKAESSDLPCRLIVDRASVSMGDDVAAHSEVWQLPGSTSIAELLTMMARRFLPRVAGFAGWRVYQDLGERGPGWPLGLIYTRDHLREERFGCLESQYLRTVDELARRAPVLVVQAAYLSGQAARPVWLSEVEAGPSFSGVELIRAAVDDGSAGRDWRTLRLLDSLAAEREGPRRAWIREHVLAGGLAAAELFAARNMGALAADLCPASMARRVGFVSWVTSAPTATARRRVSRIPCRARISARTDRTIHSGPYRFRRACQRHRNRPAGGGATRVDESRAGPNTQSRCGCTAT